MLIRVSKYIVFEDGNESEHYICDSLPVTSEKRKPGFYFWDEVYYNLVGPYPTLFATKCDERMYVKWLNGEIL